MARPSARFATRGPPPARGPGLLPPRRGRGLRPAPLRYAPPDENDTDKRQENSPPQTTKTPPPGGGTPPCASCGRSRWAAPGGGPRLRAVLARPRVGRAAAGALKRPEDRAPRARGAGPAPALRAVSGPDAPGAAPRARPPPPPIRIAWPRRSDPAPLKRHPCQDCAPLPGRAGARPPVQASHRARLGQGRRSGGPTGKPLTRSARDAIPGRGGRRGELLACLVRGLAAPNPPPGGAPPDPFYSDPQSDRK